MINKALSLASLVAMVLLAACGGGSSSSSPIPLRSPGTASANTTTGNASFLVIVPSGTQATAVKKKRPAFVAPSGTQSVSFTLESVNGTAVTTTPTVAVTSASTPGCESANGQLTCAVNISVPVGTLVFQIDTYSSTSGSGTPTGEGLIQFVVTAGQSTTVSLSLGGTIATIVLSMGGVAELGATASLPIIVDAMDANGATIIGTYDTPITLSDTDSSGQTSLSSTAAISSSTAAVGVTLNYIGGAMSTPAAIGATESNIAASSITGTTFLPDTTAPTVNGASTTFAYVQSDSSGYDALPAPSPWPTSSGTFTVGVTTGASFNGQSNLVAITGLSAPTAGSPQALNSCCYLGSDYSAYFAWTNTANATTLGYVGLSYGIDTETCATPLSQQLILPFPASWNVLNGAGACTFEASFNNGPTFFGDQTTVFNSDGSYSDNGSENYTFCCADDFGSYSFSSQSNGSVSMTDSSGFSDSYILTIPAPTSAGDVTATYQCFGVGPIPSPGTTATPVPVTTTAPNPWVVAGIASGIPPNPLESDTFTTVGSIALLPLQCAVSPTILGATPSLNEADEAIVYADPMDDWNANYTTTTIKHYYLNGVGEVCNENSSSYWSMDGGALGWYNGGDQNYDTQSSITYTYVTSTSLTATYSRVRDFAQALPATSRAFTAATYALVRAHMATNKHLAALRAAHFAHRQQR